MTMFHNDNALCGNDLNVYSSQQAVREKMGLFFLSLGDMAEQLF